MYVYYKKKIRIVKCPRKNYHRPVSTYIAHYKLSVEGEKKEHNVEAGQPDNISNPVVSNNVDDE